MWILEDSFILVWILVPVGYSKMKTKNILSLSNEEFKTLMDSIDVVLSDCDGEWLFSIKWFFLMIF